MKRGDANYFNQERVQLLPLPHAGKGGSVWHPGFAKRSPVRLVFHDIAAGHRPLRGVLAAALEQAGMLAKDGFEPWLAGENL